ncbi:aldehyde dehydrogenase [Rhodococcus koreensis]|uniref:aldehyde dehydrogenase n=1 Tax=Rhodococcus koreensis TaxID=99653 RepID=UPI0019826DF4|nr:aldehyde dehydrogenase [Rhodococcus koreensis]QSE86095.1 aldehyde dehydrogenase [Rhodococcus koreensis]
MTDHSQLFIGGEWVAPSGKETIEVISPWTEEVIASVPAGTPEDVDRAVAAARGALKSGPWSTMTLGERISIVERLRDLMLENAEELAQITTAEMGCPISQSRAIQVPNPVGILQAYVDTIKTYPFEEVRRSANGQALVVREPVGVVAGVVPWNVPLSLTMQKLIPALLTGCTIVLKPSPETPLDSYVVARLLQEAGCPPGVVSIVPADRDVSEYLISHPGVNKVTFTGSSVAGRRIAEICGKDLRRVTLELGGKSAAVVLDDADLGIVAEALRMGSFRNNGQICTLKTRILVPSKRRDDLIDHLNAMLDTMPIGDPSADATQVGPLVSARQRSVVEGFIESGRAEGGKIVRGGGRPDIDHGWFVEPTIFADVDPDATIAQREIFGPVVAVMSYESEEEAVAIANSTTYGLSGAVFSGDPLRGVRVARQLETGAVEVNGNPAGFLSPMGGVKYSGLGREFGKEGIDPFIEFKSIGIPAETAATLD